MRSHKYVQLTLQPFIHFTLLFDKHFQLIDHFIELVFMLGYAGYNHLIQLFKHFRQDKLRIVRNLHFLEWFDICLLQFLSALLQLLNLFGNRKNRWRPFVRRHRFLLDDLWETNVFLQQGHEWDLLYSCLRFILLDVLLLSFDTLFLRGSIARHQNRGCYLRHQLLDYQRFRFKLFICPPGYSTLWSRHWC
jgi:hypothetical protein